MGRPSPSSLPKSAVKNFNLRVTSSGEVHASAPLGASRERIETFVKRNSAWIISRLAQREQRQATVREPLSPHSIIGALGQAHYGTGRTRPQLCITRTATQAGHLRKFYGYR